MQEKVPIPKDVFTVRMKPDLYDKMQSKLRAGRKNLSINKYINDLIEKDLSKEKKNEKNWNNTDRRK